ncbi:MAG: hypothetical protein Q9M43_11960 [Sulfurimonas sp.]|nr:hypothetical protein [Sulfurimonas sp.]
MKTNHLKYPLYLFIAILSAKGLYVIVESFYNYYVLVTTTSADLNEASIESLNINGHRISSVGITLLFLPLFYFLLRKKAQKTMYISLAIASLFTYTLTYNMLNKAVDYIVETNKEKRHDAYYINIFKYGVLNNIFSYNSFIDSKKIKDGNIDVNDRILLTNSFLLLHADEKIISKLKERGKEVVADIYISKYKQEDYDNKFKAFKSATLELKGSWRDFNEARKKLDAELKNSENEQAIKKAHKELKSSLKRQYDKYKETWKKVDKVIAQETSQAKLKKIKKELSRYFDYQGRTSVENKYKEKMNEQFGHYIEPKRWKNSNRKLTLASIKKVIEVEILKTAKQKAKGIQRGLNAKQFFNHLDVKIKVSNRLRAKGIEIEVDFDYKCLTKINDIKLD